MKQLISFLTFCSNNKTSDVENTISSTLIPLADPFIMLHEGVYYALWSRFRGGCRGHDFR